ncbi:unnamed protein product [Choristocarpus tenellus]
MPLNGGNAANGVKLSGHPATEVHKAGMEQLDRVEKAVQGMTGHYGVFEVTRVKHELWIDLGDTVGKYWIQYDKLLQKICLLSPRSGGYRYDYHKESGAWLGEADDHDFEGMLTRDLIQQSYGLPQF